MDDVTIARRIAREKHFDFDTLVYERIVSKKKQHKKE